MKLSNNISTVVQFFKNYQQKALIKLYTLLKCSYAVGLCNAEFERWWSPHTTCSSALLNSIMWKVPVTWKHTYPCHHWMNLFRFLSCLLHKYSCSYDHVTIPHIPLMLQSLAYSLEQQSSYFFKKCKGWICAGVMTVRIAHAQRLCSCLRRNNNGCSMFYSTICPLVCLFFHGSRHKMVSNEDGKFILYACSPMGCYWLVTS